MRIDNRDPDHAYRDFWDWLFTGWHIILAVTLAFGYLYYLLTTTEV